MKSHFEILVAKTFLFGPRYISEGTRYDLALDYEENTRRRGFTLTKPRDVDARLFYLLHAVLTLRNARTHPGTA